MIANTSNTGGAFNNCLDQWLPDKKLAVCETEGSCGKPSGQYHRGLCFPHSFLLCAFRLYTTGIVWFKITFNFSIFKIPDHTVCILQLKLTLPGPGNISQSVFVLFSEPVWTVALLSCSQLTAAAPRVVLCCCGPSAQGSTCCTFRDSILLFLVVTTDHFGYCF